LAADTSRPRPSTKAVCRIIRAMTTGIHGRIMFPAISSTTPSTSNSTPKLDSQASVDAVGSTDRGK
jgi:hypothetical protein